MNFKEPLSSSVKGRLSRLPNTLLKEQLSCVKMSVYVLKLSVDYLVPISRISLDLSVVKDYGTWLRISITIKLTLSVSLLCVKVKAKKASFLLADALEQSLLLEVITLSAGTQSSNLKVSRKLSLNFLSLLKTKFLTEEKLSN